jgi:hypothetical protein
MEKEFVSYKLAVKLKELGFDEPCCGYYDHSIKELDTISSDVCERLCKHDTHIKAPLFQQAFRWFREKYSGYHGVSDTDFLFELTINGEFIRVTSTLKENRIFQENGSSYEEVELACLTKLIEIVEQKQKEDGK